MERNDNVLEEDYVLISQWDCETTDDTCKNIQELSCSIKFVGFMDKSEEALIHRLSNHLSSWNKLSIKLMENVLQVVSLDRLFRIKELQEFLDKLWGDIHFQRSHFNSFIYNELEEEFIDTLKMWPGWINLIFSFYTCFRES